MNKETLATVCALLFAIPLGYLFVGAVVDGEMRHSQAALRGMLGNATFDAIASGETPEMGYYGDDRRAPDFTLQDKDGRPWRLSDRRGKKVVVMNFWSITCGPCVEEMPTLDALARRLRQRAEDVELVTISTDANWDAVSTAIPEGSVLNVLFDPDRSVVRGKYGTRLYPETWIVDKEGVIRARIDGARDWSSALALSLVESYR